MFTHVQAARGASNSTSLLPEIQVHHGATGVLSVVTTVVYEVSWKLLSIVFF